MAEWSRFESHKIVQAAPIVSIDDGVILVDPHGDGTTEPFSPSEPAMISHAAVGGYAVIYDDGYKSISPKQAFEAGYMRIFLPDSADELVKKAQGQPL